MRRTLDVDPLPGYPAPIGRWLWALEEARRRTLRFVEDLPQELLDWEGPDGNDNAIGSLLYHLALAEMDWLYVDTLEQPFPDDLRPLFPHHHVDDAGRMTRILGVSLADHLARLARCREVFLDAFRGMSFEEWTRLREPEGTAHAVTPAWVVFHLVEHEAGHAFQISSLRRRAERALGVG